MKLFTIGDSISQGFMSGAAARTDLAYSTLIAKQFGINNYHFPAWEKGGHPVNVEELFRTLESKYGNNIRGPIEWPRAVFTIKKYLDQVEDFYERGPGNLAKGTKPYHNVAVRGFDVSNAWQIKPSLCKRFIDQSRGNKDEAFGTVDESFLRTAHTVLSSGTSTTQDFSTLDWLRYHHQNEGVENTILWLGANNALGTVLTLKINQTSNDGSAFKDGPGSVSYDLRRENDWNLWHPEDFRVEYQFLIDQVVEILENNPHNVDYKVFVGTIPLVTIAPIIKAVGDASNREQFKVKEWPIRSAHPAPMNEDELAPMELHEYSYGKYYPYFPFADDFDINDEHLNQQEVMHIDNSIRKYNRVIQEIVMQANKRLNARRFYIVDIGTVLSDMALKRNNAQPKYIYPSFFDYVYPRLDTRYYGTTRTGQIKAGGIFSLDGVHPTAIGQGLLAFEFLKVMKQAGSYSGDPENDLPWKEIFASDSLYSNPISLLSEIYDNVNLAKVLLKLL